MLDQQKAPLRQPDVCERTEPLCGEIFVAIEDAQVASRGLVLNRMASRTDAMKANAERISNKLNQALILVETLKNQLARG